MASEKDLLELVMEVILVFIIIIIVIVVIFPGLKDYAARLSELPRSFFVSLLDKIGYSWWG